MNFLNPIIFWGLLALIIPVIVHLFYFRRYKKVLFTNVQLLKEVVQESATRNRIKYFLILASRLLALGLLVLAFAQPIKQAISNDTSGNKWVTLFIDNSFSMQAEEQNGRLFDRARTIAKEIILSQDDYVSYQIVSHDLDIPEKRWTTSDNAIAYIDKLNITGKTAPFETIWTTIEKLHKKEEGNHEVFIISDFIELLYENPVQDSTLAVTLIPLSGLIENNVSIDTAYFLNPTLSTHQTNPLIVSYTNHGNQQKNQLKVQYVLNDKVQPAGSLNIEKGEQKTDTLNIELQNGGWQSLEIRLQEGPITYDNSYFLGLDIIDQAEVLNIKDSKTTWDIKKAYQQLPYVLFTEQSAERVDYSKIFAQDLIILQGASNLTSGLTAELTKYLNQGGNILLLPTLGTDVAGLNQWFRSIGAPIVSESEKDTEINIINRSSSVFQNVYDRSNALTRLPKSNRHLELSRGPNGTETLLRYRNGKSALNRYNISDGQLFVLSTYTDVASSDFSTFADLWLPMIYNMALYNEKNNIQVAQIGAAHTIDINESTEDFNEALFKIHHTSQEFIPQQQKIPNGYRIFIKDEIKTPGLYYLKKDEDVKSIVGLNASRSESIAQALSETALQGLWPEAKITAIRSDAGISQLTAGINGGSSWWRYALLAVCLFLLVESSLIRWLKS